MELDTGVLADTGIPWVTYSGDGTFRVLDLDEVTELWREADQALPWIRIRFSCDTCAAQAVNNYILPGPMTADRRMSFACDYLTTTGWVCSTTGDYCPDHRPWVAQIETEDDPEDL